MRTTHSASKDPHEIEFYEIRLQGHLDARRADWFEGASVTHASDGTTVLTGPVADQAALHSLLRRVRDLGLPLIAVNRVGPKQANGPEVNANNDHTHSTQETHMNTSNLIRWAGLSTVVAGICFVVLGLLHPENILSSVTTPQWAIVHILAIAMSLFGLLGLTGIYARQAQATGWLGLAGYLLMSLWLVLVLPFTFFETFVLPVLATEAPAIAAAFLGIFTGSAGAIDFGVLPTIWTLTEVLLLLGGLVFGITTLRANVLSRWAAGLFTAGIASAPIFGLLPHALEPLVTVPIGAGLAWLGYALWSERHVPAAQPVPGRGSAQLRQTGAQ